MKNRRKKIAGILFAAALAGSNATGVLQIPGTLTVMASEVEGTAETIAEDGKEPQVAITIQAPDGWQKEKAEVHIQAEDTQNTGNFTVAKMEAKISENGNWTDITNSGSITVAKNSSVYAKVTDQNGTVYTENRYIESIDNTKPTLSAAAKDGVLVIRGEDADSGVAAIYVNGNEFTELTENILSVQMQKADTGYEYFTLQIRDNAGNMSENYKVANPYYKIPQSKVPSNKNSSANTSKEGTESNTNELPADATASKPASATGTVTEHTTSTTSGNAESTPEAIQTDKTSSVTTKEGGKEFYTITTKGNKVFYLIVDKDKTSNNVYFLTEVAENDLLNFTDSNTVTLPQNSAVIESALPDVSESETDQEETEKKPMAEKETEKTDGNTGTFVLMALVLVGVGAFYFLKIRKKKESFEAGYDEEDEDEEEHEEEEPEYDSEEEEEEEEESDSEEEEYL